MGGGFGFSVGFEPICIWVAADGCGCSYGFRFVTGGVVDLGLIVMKIGCRWWIWVWWW